MHGVSVVAIGANTSLQIIGSRTAIPEDRLPKAMVIVAGPMTTMYMAVTTVAMTVVVTVTVRVTGGVKSFV
jgi:hypothetical protein